jgi:hypothetical protein
MPVGLLDEIAEESRPPVVRCSVAVVLDDLPDAERTELEAALADPATYTHRAITTVLKRRGYDMHDKRVANHRKGECACARG